MPFTRASASVPTNIRTITVTLRTKPEGIDGPAIQSAFYSVEVHDQNGSQISVVGESGDLIPHLPQSDAVWLLDFMARLRTKAESEFLP